MTEEKVFEIKVTEILKTRKEQNNWVKLREPYPDERTLTKEEKDKDPQMDYRRVFTEVELKEEVFSQRVSELDMAAFVSVVNKIKGDQK